MNKLNRFISTLCFVILLGTVLFPVPVCAQETPGEYLGTLGPGESISTRGIAYAVYQISATCIPAYGGWCPNCSSGGLHTSATAAKVYTTYSICVDGYSVLDYSSVTEGTGTIDLSQFTNKDATLSVPKKYNVVQNIPCVGGNIANSNDPVEPCGYVMTRKINVSGTLQLYGYSKVPEVVSNPLAVSAGTDQSAVFTAAGNKVAACRWQKITAAGITDLKEGADEDGVSYSGTSSLQLTVSRLRTRLNGASFRCILIGEKGDEVPTESAPLTVTDITAPKIKLTQTPTDHTDGEVTVRITAVDADSGLQGMPYYYLGNAHEQNSFTVGQNGSYEVKVTDLAGNTSSATISVSNIRAKEQKQDTPVKPEPTSVPQTPAPTQTPQAFITPAPVSPVPTQAPSSPGEKKKENDQKEEKKPVTQTGNKNVNIRNLTAGNQNNTQKTTPVIEEESVEEEVMMAEAPEEEVIPESVDESGDPVGMILLICAGMLVLIALLFLALLFPVRVENADELGNWHFCALKMLRYHKKEWSLQLGLLLEDFDSVRLKFGMLFMALVGDKSLEIIASDGERMTVNEVTQDLVLHYHQMGRPQ